MKAHFPLHHVCIAVCMVLQLPVSLLSAYTVSDFNAEYHNGQIFITWTNPVQTNLQYNVYRSTTPLLLPEDLTPAAFLGFVRDHSAKNQYMENATGDPVYYRITDGGAPLLATQGLYVVTCYDNQSYYYVVTVTDLGTGVEDPSILPGINGNLLPIADSVAKPQAVFQDSIQTNNDEWKKFYVMYVDNRETPLFPAMNSTGSYGFNFYTLKRGSASEYPLFLLFESLGNNADKNINLDDTITNCYVMGIFDWLPVKQDDGSIGQSDYFCCYHEDFNIYSNDNPVPTTGIVRTYSQKLYWEQIEWLESQVPIDTNKRYCKGSSSEGYGALLTAALAPERIAAVYGIVEPNSTSPGTNIYKQMWGSSSNKLNTDRIKYGTSDTLNFWDMKDIQKMVHYNRLRSVPVIYDIHGKNDVTVTWNSGKIKWFDSLESNCYGGVRYWDQRTHGGDGSNFLSEETAPDYYRFATDVSYPAFSNCSVNQDPGDGTPTVGDPYGAINGYLDWDGSNIKDKPCLYNIHLLMKDLYVGGILDPEQYTICTADVTIRRPQKFAPTAGATIKWTNYDDVTGLKLQNGSIVYDGGLITIPGLTIKKTGCLLKLKLPVCNREEGEDEETVMESHDVDFAKTPNGYRAYFMLEQDEDIQISLVDLTGRTVWRSSQYFSEGDHSVDIPAPGAGIFIVTLDAASFQHAQKLFF